MADTQTAEQWKQAAAALEQQRAEVFKQFDVVREQQEALRKSILGYNRVINSLSSTPEQKSEAQQQKTAAESQIRDLNNQAAQLENQADSLRDQRNEALTKAKTAEAAPANTSNITDPANSQPGSNTQVPSATADVTKANAEPATVTEPQTTSETESSNTGRTSPPTPAEDEFGNLDAAIADQQGTGLTEPPVLSEEETNAYLNSIQNEEQPTPTEQDVLAGPKGLTAKETNTRTQATQQDEANFKQSEDWRVRLSLAPESKYLYNVEGAQGILAPLAATDGILFPYTPNIQVTYAASYEAPDVAHTNYKIYQYKNSSVDSIQISCDFTAQDTFEANYLLAVIHFLRSITKMFYGQDQNPKPGVPPPLCYLTGLGAFQFDAHPLAVTNFTYNLPIDVDYIRAGTTTTNAGVNKSSERSPDNSGTQLGQRSTGVGPGATVPAPKFKNVPGGTIEPTYVPTKMQIQISAIPIITRNNISNNFSLKDYATGKLLQGSQTRRGGMW